VSVEDLLNAVAASIENAGKAKECYRETEELLIEARDALAAATKGSRAAEPAAVRSELGAVLSGLQGAHQKVIIAVARLEIYERRIRGDEPSAAPGQQGSAAQSTEPVAAVFTNEHGDRYPPEAAGLAKRLPKRVVPRTGDRTVGAVARNGQYLMTIESGSDRAGLVKDAEVLLQSMGIEPKLLGYHVEIKLATFMLLRKPYLTDLEVAINYTPCGVERQMELADVCDKVLTRLFPSDGDRSLTVYGTYQNNAPFRKHYGRVKQ
jgi:hypothetical protein